MSLVKKSNYKLKFNHMKNTIGYVSKKIVITATSNPIKKVISQVLQFALKSVMPSSADSYADSE